LGKEEAVAHIEVQIESSSVAAVCGLHHAVLCRIQVQTATLSTFMASLEKLSDFCLSFANLSARIESYGSKYDFMPFVCLLSIKLYKHCHSERHETCMVSWMDHGQNKYPKTLTDVLDC